MRVVVVHNHYNSSVPSGENTAVTDELKILPQHGIDAIPFTTTSDELIESRWAALRTGGAPVFSMRARHQFGALLDRSRPDIVHLHNTYPRLGPSIIGVARARHIPVVQTVHNRRISCISGTHFRDGRACTDCVGRRFPWPGAVHACYRNSNAQSLVMMTSAVAHYRTLRDLDHYFAVSTGIAEVLQEAGVPRRKVTVKPNPVPDPGVADPPTGRRVLYAGRLDESKGARLLLDAWATLKREARPRLRVCGAGPLEEKFRATAAEHDDLEFMGSQTREQVRTHIFQATAVAVPSLNPEGLPRVVAEAFAAGRPVLATDVDPLVTVVGPHRGWCVAARPAAIDDALLGVKQIAASALKEMGAAARNYYEGHFHPAAVVAIQRKVYEGLLTGTAL